MSRWLRTVLLANGISTDLPWEDAQDVAEMLVATGRAVPGIRWIDHLVAEELNDRHEGDF